MRLIAASCFLPASRRFSIGARAVTHSRRVISPFGPQLGQLVQLRLGALDLGLPLARRRGRSDAAVQGLRQLGRVEPVQDGLDHVLLERLGHDRHLAAAAEARAAGADVAAARRRRAGRETSLPPQWWQRSSEASR